jgi:hypothetical protein
MEKRQNGNKSLHTQHDRKNNRRAYETMADPKLLEKVQVQGIRLQETGLHVLGLSGYDLKRLGDAGILSFDQLANCLESNILNIPHFGVMKVRRMKAGLGSYLNSRLNSKRLEPEPGSGIPDKEAAEPVESSPPMADFTSKGSPQPELEAFSKSLDKLEKRVKSLKSRLARARERDQEKDSKVAV